MGRASSVEFLDPELLAGARPSRRTEVWALGATVHRALAGTGLYGELPDAQPLLAIRRVLSSQPQMHPTLNPATPPSFATVSPPRATRPPPPRSADRLAPLRP